MHYLTDSWDNLGGVAHHEDQDNHHGDSGQPELPLPQGVVTSPGRVGNRIHINALQFSCVFYFSTSEQQQDNLPACCRLPCSDKIGGSREGQRQRQDGPRERRPMECGEYPRGDREREVFSLR